MKILGRGPQVGSFNSFPYVYHWGRNYYIIYRHPVLTLHELRRFLMEDISLISDMKIPLKLQTLKAPTP